MVLGGSLTPSGATMPWRTSRSPPTGSGTPGDVPVAVGMAGAAGEAPSGDAGEAPTGDVGEAWAVPVSVTAARSAVAGTSFVHMAISE
ncbi:hypothetical protein GCM10010486_65320 [Nonomuraea roseoviolacea subsp. carminata]